MPIDVDAARARSLDAIVEFVRAKAAPDEREVLAAFVLAYLGQVDPEDLAERRTADLGGAALSHSSFARPPEPRRAPVRAFNPSLEEHGFQSSHTIVEIVNDDMPFLVDSVTMEVNRSGLTLHLIVHPVIAVLRAADGSLQGLAADAGGNATQESFIHVEVDRITDADQRRRLEADIERVLGDVRSAVDDWKPMRAKLETIVAEVEARPPPLAADELTEGKDFLRWLAHDKFTFLGYRCHDLVMVDGVPALKIVPGTSLGILRESTSKDVASSFAALPVEVREYARRPELLVITKSTSRSTVHRPGYLDYIAVKRFDGNGDVRGEHRFLGLYTAFAYSAHPAEIPLLRHKVANVVARAGLSTGGHASKALTNILEHYPRDELFQITEDELVQTAMGILHLGDRQRFRLFVRRDLFERFMSCLIYAPRESYTTELRQKWQALLLQAFNGNSADFNVHLSESVLARVTITVRTTPGRIPNFDLRTLEARLADVTRRWEDDLKAALIEAVGEARGNELLRAFGNAFPAGYREDHTARAAVADIEMMERLSAADPLGMRLYRPLDAAPGMLRFKLFHHGRPITLSDSLPMLERMGQKVLDEHPYRIAPVGSDPIWIHDLGMQSRTADAAAEIGTLQGVFEDAFGCVFRGEVENDDFNRLVTAAQLPAAEIVVLRAYAKYLRQIGFPLSQSFIETPALAAPASPGNSANCSRPDSIPTRALVAKHMRSSRYAPSRPRSKRWTIYRKTARCGNTWR